MHVYLRDFNNCHITLAIKYESAVDSPFSLPLVVSVGVGDLSGSAEVILQVLK